MYTCTGYFSAIFLRETAPFLVDPDAEIIIGVREKGPMIVRFIVASPCMSVTHKKTLYLMSHE